MGNASNSALKNAPAGGSLLVLQTSSCETPSLKDAQKLQKMVPVSDSDWTTFQRKVEEACGKMTNEKLNFLTLAGMSVGVLLILILTHAIGYALGATVGYAVIIMNVAGFFGVRYYVSSLNQLQDDAIRAACDELQKQGPEAGASFVVEYRTEFVGACRPKHAKPFRGIAFSPGAPLIVTGSLVQPTIVAAVQVSTHESCQIRSA